MLLRKVFFDWNYNSYIKISSDFINKINCIHSSLRETILRRVDVTRRYSSIPYKTRLNALKWTLGKRDSQNISTENIVKIAGLILKNYF